MEMNYLPGSDRFKKNSEKEIVGLLIGYIAGRNKMYNKADWKIKVHSSMDFSIFFI